MRSSGAVPDPRSVVEVRQERARECRTARERLRIPRLFTPLTRPMPPLPREVSAAVVASVRTSRSATATPLAHIDTA